MKPIALNCSKWYLTLVGGACIAAAGFTSCADDADVQNAPAASRIASFVTAPVDSKDTRAANGSWDAGDQIGIYMVPHVALAADAANLNSDYAATSSNVPYQVSEAGASASLQVVAGKNSITYPTDNAEVNFVAYYPYQGDTHTTNNNIYQVDVSTQSPAKAIDLCYHKGTGTAYSQRTGANDVALGFTHQLSKIKFSVTSTTMDLSEATLTLTGFPSTANFDLATGTFGTPGGTNAVLTPVKDATLSSGECAVFEALLVPHTNDDGALERKATFVIGGKTYTYMLPNDDAFLSGESYSYQLGTGAILLAGNANCIMVPSNNKQGSKYGFAFDIAPQLAKYGTYKATGSLKAADVDSKNATQVIADGAAWTAKVIWQTAPNLITLAGKTGTGPTGNIRFTLPEADIQGNALIAVEVGGDIVWSWHLWVLNHDPGTTAYTPNNTDAAKTVPAIEYTFLDYNLGATTSDMSIKDSWGLYYQWGRKDPFPIEGELGAVASGYYDGSGTQYSNPASSTGGGTSNYANLAESVKEPNVFITTNWLGSTATGANATLAGPAGAPSWGGYDNAYSITSYLTDKTVFDPCPEGYRVPPIGAFGNELSNADNKLAANFKSGYDWTTITGGYGGSSSGPGIFPAGGNRSSSTGALDDQGTTGYYWSASLYSDPNGYYLSLTSGNAYPRNLNNRVYGFGVRCVVSSL